MVLGQRLPEGSHCAMIMSKYVVERWEKTRSRTVCVLWRQRLQAVTISFMWEAWCDNWGHSDVWACATIEGCVWVHDRLATRVCVDVHGLCYHQRLWGLPWSGLLPEAMYLSEGHYTELAPALSSQPQLHLTILLPHLTPSQSTNSIQMLLLCYCHCCPGKLTFSPLCRLPYVQKYLDRVVYFAGLSLVPVY